MAKSKKKKRVFSAHEVANFCDVVNQTAINWIRSGHLEAYTTPGGQYRVYADVLAKFMQNQRMRVPDEVREIVAQQAKIKRILIIDDDQALNDSVKQFLDKRYPDFIVAQALDGYDAGRAVLEQRPNVVILDIDLPGVDGYKLTGLIKADENLSRPIVIALTGMEDPEVESRVREAGVDGFIKKPIDLETLPTLIDELAVNRSVPPD